MLILGPPEIRKKIGPTKGVAMKFTYQYVFVSVPIQQISKNVVPCSVALDRQQSEEDSCSNKFSIFLKICILKIYHLYIIYKSFYIFNLETSRSPSRRCWRQVGESEADFYILFTGTGTANVSWMDGRKQHGDGRCDGSALGWGWLGLVKRLNVAVSQVA